MVIEYFISIKHSHITLIFIFHTLAEPCEPGQYLDQTNGCQDCPEDTWSSTGNIADSCTSCPVGKEVAAGQGKQESDCTWSEFYVESICFWFVIIRMTSLQRLCPQATSCDIYCKHRLTLKIHCPMNLTRLMAY